MAIGLMRPDLSGPIELAMPAKVSCTSPAITAGTASEMPLYGTCTRSMPAWYFSISPERCGWLPLP